MLEQLSASEQRFQDSGANKHRGYPHHRNEDPFLGMPMDDDPYSRVKDRNTIGAVEGGWGLTAHGQEHTDADSFYTDVDTIIRKDRLHCKKQYKANPLYATTDDVTPLDSDDHLYIKVRKQDLHTTSTNTPYSLNNIETLVRIHANNKNTNDCYKSEEDLLNTVADKNNALISDSKYNDPLYSTVKKKKQSSETSRCTADADVNKDDHVFSFVDKKTHMGLVSEDWNRTVQPAPSCSNVAFSPYSKVNKNTKEGTRTNEDSGLTKNATPDDYPYSVVKKVKRERTASDDNEDN